MKSAPSGRWDLRQEGWASQQYVSCLQASNRGHPRNEEGALAPSLLSADTAAPPPDLASLLAPWEGLASKLGPAAPTLWSGAPCHCLLGSGGWPADTAAGSHVQLLPLDLRTWKGA